MSDIQNLNNYNNMNDGSKLNTNTNINNNNESLNKDNRLSFRFKKNEIVQSNINNNDVFNEDDDEKRYREFENNIQVDSIIQRNWNSFHFTRQYKKSIKDNTNIIINTTSHTTNTNHLNNNKTIDINIHI